MKKILFTILAVSSLLVVSCRDSSDDMFSPEDQANLEVLNNASADGGMMLQLMKEILYLHQKNKN